MKFIQAVLILSGMIIGVGMFGIPFSFARAGFWLGVFELVALTGLMAVVHFLYAKVILATSAPHRLPGYAELYLGRPAEVFAILSSFFGIIGSLLAYILVGSIFLHNVFQGFWAGSSEMFWAIMITASSALITRFNLKKEALIDSILSAALIALLGYIIFLLFPQASRENFSGINLSEAVLPYGVLLFALAGSAAIPDVVALLGRNSKRIGLAVFAGTILPGIIYFIFALAVVGALGSGVSEEAINSLKNIVSANSFLVLGMVGFLAVYDSYIILNSNAQALLRLDFQVNSKVAWLLTTLVPFALYAIGIQNFILIIGAAGAIAGGIEVGLIIAIHHRIRQGQGEAPTWFSYGWKAAIFLMIAVGVLYEVWRNV